VNKQQKNKPDCKPNSPQHRVHPDGQDHGAAGFEQQRDVFDGRQKGKLEFGEQGDNGHAGRSQSLLHFLAEAGPRRRLWRRGKVVVRIFVLIHGRILPERARPASPFLRLSETHCG